MTSTKSTTVLRRIRALIVSGPDEQLLTCAIAGAYDALIDLGDDGMSDWIASLDPAASTTELLAELDDMILASMDVTL